MDGKFIYTGIVKENDDPLMLNRVRVYFDSTVSGLNNETILNSVPDTYEGSETKKDGDLVPKFKWSVIDPFCFLPLLPLFIKVTPKTGESVNVIWPNPNYKLNEQYYIQGPFSSPLTMFKEESVSQRMFATKDKLLKPSVNLKNPTTNQYWDSSSEGVFPEPDDVGIQGRGTCDLIIKENDLILRSGKSTTIPTNRNSTISSKKTRSFVQLSNFSDRIIFEGNEPQFLLEQNVQYVKTLIEWNIGRPENQQDNFDLDVFIYSLPENTAYTTNKITISSKVESTDKSLINIYRFFNLKAESASNQINEIIKQVNDGKINTSPYPIKKIENAHPIIFRPNELTYKWIANSDTNSTPQFDNISKIANKIKYKKEGTNGFGLIFFRNKPGQQTNVRKILEKKVRRENISTTYNILGGDKVILLSHESQIPSGKRIILDESTMNGIPQSFLAETVIPNTNSFVRGEELMKFMNLVVRFLISHVHAFPGLPPVPIATDGLDVKKILSELQNADNTILNKNIRIN